MGDWNRHEVAYAADDYWTPRDPLALARRTREAQELWTRGHKTSDGQHDNLIVPQAGGVFAWSGAAYSLLVGSNFSSTITRHAAGSLRLKLTISMRQHPTAPNTPYQYAALIWTGPHDEPVFSIENALEPGGAKSATEFDVLIKDNAGTAVDKSFLCLVFGVRA